MSKQMNLSDFRAVRVILDPDDFAGGDNEPDPAPSDPVAEDIWSGITGLPDDVAIRTSDHNGQALAEAYNLQVKWVSAIGDDVDIIFVPMMDAADDLQMSLFNVLHGYYRSGFSALRSVLELITIGTCGSVSNSQRYANWRNGSAEFSFGSACDQLCTDPNLGAFNSRMRTAGNEGLWDQPNRLSGAQGGYARRLYKDLCNYAHSRPGFTDGDIRKSNGPIYVAGAFMNWYYSYLRVISLCSLSIGVARPMGDRAALVELFTRDPRVLPTDVRDAFNLL